MILIFIFILAPALVIGCAAVEQIPDTAGSQPHDTNGQDSVSDNDTDTSKELPPEFLFQTGDITIRLGHKASPIIEALGEPLNYFEAPSCAFEGIDRIYYFKGFELFTFPVNGEDFILSINLTDDSVTTFEGIYLGMSLDRVVAAYGEDYTQNFGQYTYTRGDSTLSFLIENSEVVVIIYNYTNV